MSDEPTIRAHLLAQNKCLTKAALGIDVKANCDAAHDHAVAALALLDGYELDQWQEGLDRYRLVPDPGSAATHKEPLRHVTTRREGGTTRSEIADLFRADPGDGTRDD